MNNAGKLLLLLLLLCLNTTTVFSAPASPGVFRGYGCEINATIENWEFVEAKERDYMFACHLGKSNITPAHYRLTLNAVQSSTNRGGPVSDGGYANCSSIFYEKNLSITVWENKISVFKQGQRISGEYRPKLDECGRTHLGNYSIIEEDEFEENSLFAKFLDAIRKIFGVS